MIIDTALSGCSGILEMCHRRGKRYGSYSPATSQNEGHGVDHSTAGLSHQEAAMGLINFLISYVTPILYRIYLKYFKGVSMQNQIYYIFFNFIRFNYVVDWLFL